MKGIADTGFIVAFANRNDRFHDWAVGLAKEVTEPLLTCEAVLAEAAFHLKSVPVVLALLDERLLSLEFSCQEHLPQLLALARQFKDRQPDLADLCLIRMSELFPGHKVITIDRDDFQIYRRNRREVVPTICPPND